MADLKAQDDHHGADLFARSVAASPGIEACRVRIERWGMLKVRSRRLLKSTRSRGLREDGLVSWMQTVAAWRVGSGDQVRGRCVEVDEVPLPLRVVLENAEKRIRG